MFFNLLLLLTLYVSSLLACNVSYFHVKKSITLALFIHQSIVCYLLRYTTMNYNIII
jgi:hypothetical protein